MKPASLHTIAPLDGLRALAILLVLWCHLNLDAFSAQLVGPGFLYSLGAFGFTGVFLFFVLSGFLLFLPYARALLGGSSWPSVHQFYQRRALRILPVYLVVLSLLLSLYVAGIRYPTTPLAIAFTPLLLFDLVPSSTSLVNVMNPPFWTLAIEWQFYLLLPWIALGLAKLAGQRRGRALLIRLAFGLGFLVVSGLLLRTLAAVVHYTSGQDNPVASPGLIGIILGVVFGARGKQLDVFALGMAISLFYVWAIEQRHLSLAQQRLISHGSLILFFFVVVASFWWATLVDRVPDLFTTYLTQGQVWAVFGEWTLGVCFMLLLLAVLCDLSGLGRLFSLPPLRFIGTISYSLYAWHWPVFLLCLRPFSSPASGSLERFLLLAVVVTFSIGIASYFLIERPFLRWRHAQRRSLEMHTSKVI